MIKFKQTKSGITINIPFTILKKVTEEHPYAPAKVIDKALFLKEVMFQLENQLGDYEEGLTGFQKLIDEAIEEVVNNASDSVESAGDFEDFGEDD